MDSDKVRPASPASPASPTGATDQRAALETELGVKFCTCSREIGPLPHCTKCGSATVYALVGKARLMKSVRIIMNGGLSYAEALIEAAMLKFFRCRRCGNEFMEGSECFAPPPKEFQALNEFNKPLTKAPRGSAKERNSNEAVKRQAARAYNEIIKDAAKKGEVIDLPEARRRYAMQLFKFVGKDITKDSQGSQSETDGKASEAKDQRIP